jgi:hypothetical protein
MHAEQGRGCNGPHPCTMSAVAADRRPNFWVANAFKLDTSNSDPTLPHTTHAPLLPSTPPRMASNKKSSLTGYLPDILMAAAAVRLPIPLQTHPTLTRATAINSLLRDPQPARAPRPRSPVQGRSTRESVGRDAQTRRHIDWEAEKERWCEGGR